jgi:uncharacterized protein YycO
MIVSEGDIFLWSGTGVIAKAIQWVTGSKWSHCGLILDKNTIIDSYLQINNNGVQKRSIQPYKAEPNRVKILNTRFTPDQKLKLVQTALRYVNKTNYDIPLIFSFLVEAVQGDKKFKGMFQDGDSFTCSEFIATIVKEALGKEVVPKRPAHTIRPKDLERLENEVIT